MRPGLCPLIAMGMLACAEPALDGVVVDGLGSPLEGAELRLDDGPCTTQSDAEGRFHLPCTPGPYTLHASRAGHLTEAVAITLAPREQQSLAPLTLLALPEGEGLFVLRSGRFEPLQPGRLVRVMGGRGDEAFKNYCLPTEPTAVVEVPRGELVVFDRRAAPWRPFVLDAEGCAYRISAREDGSWDVDYSQNPEPRERGVGEGERLLRFPEVEGRIFLAAWSRAFFTRIEATTEEQQGYAGFLVATQAEP